jgi:VWFA-related protein
MTIAALTPGATSLVLAGSVLVSLASGFQTTQTAAPKSPGIQPSFHVSVKLVQVDAVVTDSEGNHVTDLRPDDFDLTTDGKLQKITYFSWIDLKTPHASSTAAPGPGRSLQKDDVRRSIVLMIDDSGTWAEQDVLPVMAAARRFVTDQILPGDLVSVTASRGGMGFYQQFTSDKQQLYAAIDHLAHRPGFGLWTVETPTMKRLDADGNAIPTKLAPGEPSYDFRGGDPPNPIGCLRWAIQGLQNIPGRKAVVLFSHSFAAPQNLVDMANRAGVVVYVIDPHGVDPGGKIISSDAPYRRLAKETGGLFLLSSPGANINVDLGKVLEDLSGYYLIGYQAERDASESSEGPPVRHNIQLKVRRRGLTVRARHGFMGVPDAAGAGPVPHTTDEVLAAALFSPFNAGNIKLHIDATYAASVPAPRTELRHPILHAMIVADGKDLKLTETNDGKQHLVYSVLIALFNQDGTPDLSRRRTFTLDLTPAEAGQIAESGVRSVMDVDLARVGQYQVRAAVRDCPILRVPISTLAEHYLAGVLRLGSNTEPGDYTLQLLAYDRLAVPKKRIAVQWTHLTVMKLVTTGRSGPEP